MMLRHGYIKKTKSSTRRPLLPQHPLHMRGTRTRMSTSVEHELTKRDLESIPQVSSRSNLALIPFACFASCMLANCSFLWFDCKHVYGIISPCDIHVSSLLDNDALCVATKMLNNL